MSVIFLGTSDFAVEPLQKLIENGVDVSCVVTQPDRRKGRGKKIQYSPVKEVALNLGLQIFQPENINETEAIDYLKNFDPNFLVVIAYGQILSEKVLTIPQIDSLNVHGSLLPKYRGAAPIERAIMNGEQKSGVCLIRVVKALDAGPVYLRREVPITETMTSGDLKEQLKGVGADILLEGIRAIRSGLLEPEEQIHDEATYAHKITKTDRYLDFTQLGIECINRIRGLQPRTFALVNFEGQPLGICKAEFVMENVSGLPGDIIKIDRRRGLLVKCKDGYLVINEVKPLGKKQMPVSAFINGVDISVGQRLETIKEGDK